jgi:ornithine cyclodeaminase/alanine dehydrogenase-like protein (mu-crystallin family)
VHINAIGSYKPNMRELDLSQLDVPKVFVDSVSACKEEAGELRGYSGEIEELGAIIGGGGVEADHNRGRGHGLGDATVYKSVGIGAMDVRVANLVFQRAERDGLGTLVDL